MALPKIGDIGEGGTQLSEGASSNGATIKVLLVALRAELDALYAKLDADTGVASTNYLATLPKFSK